MSENTVRKEISVLHPITRLIVGGAQENTMFTAAMLDKSRYKVEVVSGPQTGSEGSLIDEVRGRGVKLTILPDLVRELDPVNDIMATWNLYKMMRSENYDIVHTHSSKAGVLGRIAARLAGVPIIIHTVHGWSFHEHMHPLLKLIYVMLEKIGASLSEAIIVVAQRDIQKGLREGIGKKQQFHLIRSSIPLDDFSPVEFNRNAVRKEIGLPSGVPVLGNVGRFSQQKNPIDWVKVASIVAKAVPDCHFLLVGDGPLRDQVKEKFDESGIMDRVVFTGLRRDVPRMYAAMDVFLLTSLWEGLPRVIPQAMAMELPVIAYKADGTIEAIKNGVTGFLADPGKVGSMAGNCITLLNNEPQRVKMGKAGRAYVIKEFDLNQMIADIEKLYEDLITEKNLVKLAGDNTQ